MTEFSAAEIQKERDRFLSDFSLLEKEVSKRFIGQEKLLRETLVTLVAGGHLLLEGYPGLGKTLLLRTLAEAIGGKFSRIQFTPDLIPADLTGTEIIVPRDGIPRFEFRKGPVFTNLLLADEINRAAPKTQSALLEAMEENAVTAGGVRHPLEGLFFVMATQNPIEMEGTYPLPEAQLDRFFAKLTVPYPTVPELIQIIEETVERDLPKVSPVLSADRLLEMARFARTVPVSSKLLERIAALISATWPDAPGTPDVITRHLRYGASPRGGRALLLAAKIFALLDHRYNVAKEDICSAAPMVLRHRLLLNFEGYIESMNPDKIIAILLERV